MTYFKLLCSASVAALLATGPFSQTSAQDAEGRKAATAATKEANQALLKTLPFSDKSDFESARRGLVAPLPDAMIQGAAGNLIWDPNKYGFIKEGAEAPDTVNPSLWRQAQLINISGLFKVADHIYQVRNLDLSNMTIIEGKDGITVVDPLVSQETAKVGIDLYFANTGGKKPVKAIIYTHSHVDHYGGVRGIVDEADVTAGKTKIYAPEGFLEAAVAENVMAGNAMSRRASYMYGNLLPPDAKGQVGAGLGTTTSAGTVTLIPPHGHHYQDRREAGYRRPDLRVPPSAWLGSTGRDALVHRGAESDLGGGGLHSYASQYVLVAGREDSRAPALVEIFEPGPKDVGRQG